MFSGSPNHADSESEPKKEVRKYLHLAEANRSGSHVVKKGCQQIVSTNGLSQWCEQMVSQNGLKIWSQRVVSTNGLKQLSRP